MVVDSGRLNEPAVNPKPATGESKKIEIEPWKRGVPLRTGDVGEAGSSVVKTGMSLGSSVSGPVGALGLSVTGGVF